MVWNEVGKRGGNNLWVNNNLGCIPTGALRNSTVHAYISNVNRPSLRVMIIIIIIKCNYCYYSFIIFKTGGNPITANGYCGP